MPTTKKYFGNKTLRLQECQKQGLSVPPFVALSSKLSSRLFKDTKFRQETAETILQEIQASHYAVRSSALLEDSPNHSFAGQFETKLNVSPHNLSQAIYEVLKQASQYLKGDLDSFSLLIQKYIDPDSAGVIFTRNPLGQREMIIEYTHGSGESLVGGKIKPQKISFYSTEAIPTQLSQIGINNEIRKLFYDLETRYQFPQDIEFCIKNNIFYFLQVRPITTITKTQYEEILFLEKTLPQNKAFYFAKTELTEIAPFPDTATLDLLKHIYAKNGPVQKVYKKHKIQYQDTHFIQCIDTELFVDKEKELQSLLPSYTYFSSPQYIPKIRFDKNFFISIKNIYHLNTLKSSSPEKQFFALKSILEAPEATNFEEGSKNFLQNYEHIFEVNLLCGIALKKMEFILNKEKISSSQILDAGDFFLENNNTFKIHIESKKWQGNSLAFNDISDFAYTLSNTKKDISHIKKWWDTLPKWKQTQIKTKIEAFLLLNRFREYGRWAVVKQIHELRKHLSQSQKINSRKKVHKTLPNILSDKFISQKNILSGISAGEASGILVDRQTLDKKTKTKTTKILYSPILSPDLTEYFGQIDGIVSDQGGMLSHLAIMAREAQIPVVVHFSPSKEIKMGDKIYINGTKGEIKLVANKS
jgi:phosphoenolpyruvate synthase/pyruvate phosphate dikinase